MRDDDYYNGVTRSWKERLVLRGYGWWLRRRLSVLDVAPALRQVMRLLICLPAEASDADAALAVIPGLAACLRARMITIVAGEASTAACAALRLPVRVLTIGPEDGRWSGLPAARFVDRVKQEGVDAAIDLNPRLNLLTAALCVRTGARVRIGLQDRDSEPFFNIQLVVPPDDPSGLSHRPFFLRLLRTVEGLMGLPPKTV